MKHTSCEIIKFDKNEYRYCYTIIDNPNYNGVDDLSRVVMPYIILPLLDKSKYYILDGVVGNNEESNSDLSTTISSLNRKNDHRINIEKMRLQKRIKTIRTSVTGLFGLLPSARWEIKQQRNMIDNIERIVPKHAEMRGIIGSIPNDDKIIQRDQHVLPTPNEVWELYIDRELPKDDDVITLRSVNVIFNYYTWQHARRDNESVTLYHPHYSIIATKGKKIDYANMGHTHKDNADIFISTLCREVVCEDLIEDVIYSRGKCIYFENKKAALDVLYRELERTEQYGKHIQEIIENNT